MLYKVHKIQNGKEVILIGPFTFRDHDAFFEILSMIKEMPSGVIVFNLSRCEFLDSAAVGMLSMAQEQAFSQVLDFAIKGANEKVAELLKICFEKMGITLIDN